ncbi:MAG: FkbM family methyltransferase [Kovacikia sp.]
MTFARLIEENNVSKLDLLHIDTEGYDYEIIKLIDFQKIKPSIILYESKHLNESDKSACLQLLREQSYITIELGGDTLAYQG